MHMRINMIGMKQHILLQLLEVLSPSLDFLFVLLIFLFSSLLSYFFYRKSSLFGMFM